MSLLSKFAFFPSIIHTAARVTFLKLKFDHFIPWLKIFNDISLTYNTESLQNLLISLVLLSPKAPHLTLDFSVSHAEFISALGLCQVFFK